MVSKYLHQDSKMETFKIGTKFAIVDASDNFIYKNIYYQKQLVTRTPYLV